MNANEARKITHKANNETDDFLMEAIYKTIKNAAERGQSSITLTIGTFNGKLKPYMAKLQEMAYVVRHVPDQRDGDYVEIKW